MHLYVVLSISHFAQMRVGGSCSGAGCRLHVPASHLLLGCGLHCSGQAHAPGTEVDSLSLPGTQPHGSREGREPRAAFSPSLCACSQSKTQRPHCACWSHPKLRQLLKFTRDSPTAAASQAWASPAPSPGARGLRQASVESWANYEVVFLKSHICFLGLREAG